MPKVASHHASETNSNDFRYSFPFTSGKTIKKERAEDVSNGSYSYISKLPSSTDNANCKSDVVPISTEFQQSILKVRTQQHLPTTETDTWLRDEPMDTSMAGFLQPMSSSALGGSGGIESCNEFRGGPWVEDGSNGSPGFDAQTQVDKMSLKEMFKSLSSAKVYQEYKGTVIKESVLQAVQAKYGGGENGTKGVVMAIMMWLNSKSNCSSLSGERCISDASASRLDEVDQISWPNLECASVVDSSQGQTGQQQHHYHAQDLNLDKSNNGHSLPTSPEQSCLTTPSSSRKDGAVSGRLCGLSPGDRGSGDHCGQVQPNYECQLPSASSFIGLQPQGSSPEAVAEARKVVMREGWVPADLLSLSARTKMIRKLSPSSENGVHSTTQDVIANCDDSRPEHHSQIRRQSPSSAGYNASSQSWSTEFPGYSSSSTLSASEALGTQAIFGPVGANPFAPGGPFNMHPSSPHPIDSHTLDFNAFSTRASLLVDENLGVGNSFYGQCPGDSFSSLDYSLASEHSHDRKRTSSVLGVSSKSKASPAACTRLARKQRMDRNRKAALYQVNRAAFENNGQGKSGGVSSPGSVRNMCRSQGSPASDGPTCRTKDRRDQENLQFLLMKVLRPSDVGNLGRIVLPKKDAESHLPWLAAREGIQFKCEDYDTGESMTLRYRFWPNNKSRMYLLENTGEFVKRHHLQMSDRMLIYRTQPQGNYIIRARKAHDCVDTLPDLDQREDTKEISDHSSPGSSVTSVLSGNESSLGSGHDAASESRVPVPVITTSQTDLLNFADLPDAPMGESTENLVRFPSLESFDVDQLGASTNEVTSCVGNKKEE